MLKKNSIFKYKCIYLITVTAYKEYYMYKNIWLKKRHL